MLRERARASHSSTSTTRTIQIVVAPSALIDSRAYPLAEFIRPSVDEKKGRETRGFPPFHFTFRANR